MIEDYRSLAVFVAIAEEGSLTAAGLRLKLSTSVVSHHLSRLEDKLGVTLFFRSTRSMSLTSEGRNALDAARRMVAAGEEALHAITADSSAPVGHLRVTVPAFGAQATVQGLIWDFVRDNPGVTLALEASDHQVDLVKGAFDLAIRFGKLADSSLKTRRIADFQLVLVASADYVARKPKIETIEDLSEHDFVAIRGFAEEFSMHRRDHSSLVVPQKARIEVNSVTMAIAAVNAGLGIRQLPVSDVAQELESGALVKVLPDWSLPTLGVYAVWPDAGPQKALTRRLINYLIENGKI